MALLSLVIRNVRNIRDALIEPAERINLIIGKNGSGKTAFLESIFLLGRGRSFRTSYTRELINNDSEGFIVSGKIGYDGKNSRRLEIKTEKKS